MTPISPTKAETPHGNPGPPGVVSALDGHWAVTAIDAHERARALAAAQRFWSAKHGPANPNDEDIPAVSVLATAYDVAALDWLDPYVRAFSGNGTPLSSPPNAETLRPALVAVAARAFQLHRVLPLRGHGEAGLIGLLHVASLATVGDRRADLGDWLRAGDPLAPLKADADADWATVLTDRLAHVWIDLLAPTRATAYRRAVTRLGAIREERETGETALLAPLGADEAAAVRFRLFTLYHIADAAAALITYLTRSEPGDILRQLNLHFTVARAAASGNATVDVALSWLHGAAVMLAQRRTEQLALPGLAQ
ncbi:MAG TPA: hypothetical protein VK807_09310 [Gemmatimonadaceae bacterium]|jgi:hypothetical protein|nr:hypothetical protein [Gemmatimonadaceae bacterium]